MIKNNQSVKNLILEYQKKSYNKMKKNSLKN